MHSFSWFAIALAPLVVAQRVSTSARCGPDFGLTCQGSRFGNCCSQYSYCGSTDTYCGTGCQNGFGTCKVSSSSSVKVSSSSTKISSSSTKAASSAVPSTSQKASTNGRCGSLYNASPKEMTCQGSTYGNCCSQYSYCGSSDAYCGTGCQPGFGSCKALSSSSSPVPSTSSGTKVSTLSSVGSSTTGPSAISSALSTSTSIPSVSSSSSVLPLSSTSSASPSSSSLVQSSSIVSSTLEPSSSIPLSPSASPTPTPSSDPICTGTPRANYLVNGQIDQRRGDLEPGWSTSQSAYGVTFAGGHGDNGQYYNLYANDYSSDVPVYSDPLVQTVSIPAGTTVSCSAWIKLDQGDGTLKTFDMRIDGVLCAQTTQTAVGGWQQLTGGSIKLAGETHVVSIQMMQVSTVAVVRAGIDDVVVSQVCVEPPAPTI